MRRTARKTTVDFAELSDPGLDPDKQLNEDCSGFVETKLGLLSVVCDGMGGHTHGRQASETAVGVILRHGQQAPASLPPAELLRSALGTASAAVFDLGGSAPKRVRPGCTCVAALLTEQGVLAAHVGDSRLMLIRGRHLTRLTRDHTMVRQLVDAGILTEAEAAAHPDANRITRALGMTREVDVETMATPVPLQPDDVLLLTSDGVTDLLGDEELASVVREHLGRGGAAVCQELVRLGNSRGGHDNMTVQLLHVVEVPTARAAGQTVLLDDDHTQADAPATERLGETAPDQAQHPARPTLPDRAVVEPTVLDEPVQAPAPTLLDESPTSPATQMQLPPAAPLPEQPPEPASPVSRRTLRRVILLASFIAVGLVLAWSGRHCVVEEDQDDPPPPEPAPSPRTFEGSGEQPGDNDATGTRRGRSGRRARPAKRRF